MKEKMKIVPDTSVIIDGRISERIINGEYKNTEIYIPEAVIAELESQANKGIEIGFRGLDELKEIRKLADI
ncbi:ATPase, partial [Methanosalsum natronophilum]